MCIELPPSDASLSLAVKLERSVPPVVGSLEVATLLGHTYTA
jgi:hypothetical protein